MTQKKSFVQHQVALHGKCTDILSLITQARKRLNAAKRELQEWNNAQAYDIIRLKHSDDFQLKYVISWKKVVLIRLYNYYIKHIGMLIDPAISGVELEETSNQDKVTQTI